MATYGGQTVLKTVAGVTAGVRILHSPQNGSTATMVELQRSVTPSQRNTGGSNPFAPTKKIFALNVFIYIFAVLLKNAVLTKTK